MKNKRKSAAALQYNMNEQIAPKVTAAGKGFIAENIITKAKENNVPILEDPTLVALLSELNINETIPDEMYEAVAEVFAFIYQIDQAFEKEK